MAAVLACGPRAVLSHRSAAALWGLTGSGQARIDVTAPGRRGRAPVGIAAHRHGSLRANDRTSIRGIPCTSLARTLLDFAAVATPDELRKAIAQAEILRVFDLAAVREALRRSRRRRGVARLRRALAMHDPRSERLQSELEHRFLALCTRARLPAPEVNVPMVFDGIRIEVDFLWRDAGLIVETDGRRYHDTMSAFEDDRRRDQLLVLNGWRVIRCTWRQVVGDPEGLAHTLRAILGSS